MSEFLSKYGALIFILLVSTCIGIFIGLHLNDGGNIYFQYSIGRDKQFLLGKNTILDFNLEKITDEEAAALLVRIKKLPITHKLSKGLRYSCDNKEYIFIKEDKDLVVKFIDSENIRGIYAGACKNTIPYGKRISIFKIKEPKSLQNKIKKRMMDFNVIVLLDHSFCKSCPISENTIWVSNKKAQELLCDDGKECNLPEKLLVSATILSTIISNNIINHN